MSLLAHLFHGCGSGRRVASCWIVAGSMDDMLVTSEEGLQTLINDCRPQEQHFVHFGIAFGVLFFLAWEVQLVVLKWRWVQP